MSYQISRLDFRVVGKGPYFFDTNVWLLVLGIRPDPSPDELKYIQYFNNVFTAARNGETVILLPAMTISEIVNRYIQNVEMVKYAKSKGEDSRVPNYFKSKYKLTAHYKQARAKIYDDLSIYRAGCRLISDSFGEVGFGLDELLDTGSDALDFVDNYFYTLARHHGAIFITTDGDFFKKDLTILTLNRQLIERSKNTVVPKK